MKWSKKTSNYGMSSFSSWLRVLNKNKVKLKLTFKLRLLLSSRSYRKTRSMAEYSTMRTCLSNLLIGKSKTQIPRSSHKLLRDFLQIKKPHLRAVCWKSIINLGRLKLKARRNACTRRTATCSRSVWSAFVKIHTSKKLLKTWSFKSSKTAFFLLIALKQDF